MLVMLIFTNAIFLEYLVTNQSSFLINSDVLYPKDSSSPHSGVPAEVLCRGRDFVVSIQVFVVCKGKMQVKFASEVAALQNSTAVLQ